jgi:neutral ceramidase
MLQIGFGTADITPSIGAEIPGGFTKNVSKGIKDKLYAVACVVYDGTTPVALVGIDTLMISRPTVEAARRAIGKATKIPFDNILIGASHTHTGGPIIGCFGSEGDPEYLDKVAKAIGSAVGDAWNTLHASEVGIGVGQEGSISFNRRFLMRDGREITHPGKPGTPHHEEIVMAAGPIDQDVGVLRCVTIRTR